MEALPNIIRDEGEKVYTYYKHEVITKSLQENAHNLAVNTKCRFLTSKGKNGKKRKLDDATVVLPEQDNDPKSERITIMYPKGSTYNIRKSFLYPILEKDYQILVSPETDLYRRLCWVHTRPNDSFIEIGSDYGFNIGSVVCDKKLGIDKSAESVATSKKNYPIDDFIELNLLEIPEEEIIEVLSERKLRNEDVDGGLVVAIDINGNRELEAVEDCLKRVLECWVPKLVIVKSRSLYAKMTELNIGNDV
ncbi:hypothetical protein CTEN210_17070 [Chaetoceros tenuissimus]|uniref:Methyltransferase n=1 Tax=Chaetoceros tenuissimus TaxID=426638 RepID=A0AAD3DA12_9STRA|nr:hypothetical protein CTEN210_17070 [Chaetoceros tenuissimus]